MKSRLIAGIVSLLIVLLAIVGPGYLSKNLEVIQTSGSGLYSVSTITGEGESIYNPYLEFSEETKCGYSSDYTDQESGVYWNVGGWYAPTLVSYNIEPHWTMTYLEQSGATAYCYIVFNASAFQINADGINKISLGIDCEETYSIHQLQWMGQTSDYQSNSKSDLSTDAWYTSWKAEENTGLTWYNNSLGPADFTLGINVQSSYDVDNLFLMLNFVDGYTSGTPLEFSFQIHPAYYTTVTYENETIYEPYIVPLTPFTVHKMAFYTCGILIFIVGLIASPFPIGRALNGILPINNYQKKRRGKQ